MPTITALADPGLTAGGLVVPPRGRRWSEWLAAWWRAEPTQPVTSVTLAATLREIAAAHPDFGRPRMGSARVAPRLQAGKPVWDGGSSVASAASFHEWFHDVRGVNHSRPFVVVVRNGGPAGPQVFDFPPDPQANFGPDDGEHPAAYLPASRRGFTIELHTQFVYGGGELLSYGSDDDLWVFMNGRLAVDLGGVHPFASRTIDLDDLAPSLGLVRGGTYDFDLFFADRDRLGSNLHFSLPTPLAAVLRRT